MVQAVFAFKPSEGVFEELRPLYIEKEGQKLPTQQPNAWWIKKATDSY
jgi:hypothetical protein